MYINWWGDEQNTQDEWFTRFFSAACSQWEGMDSSNMVFYSVFGDIRNIRRKEGCVNIFFTGENLYNMHQHYNQFHLFDHQLDLILGFTNSPFPSSKFMYFPLWIMYWDFWKDGLFTPMKNDDRENEAIIIANHTANGIRTRICDYVRDQGIPIASNRPNLFGKCEEVTLGASAKDKKNCIKQFRYNICPENSIQYGYTTEKVFQSVEAGCTPIYWGAPFILDVIDPAYVAFVDRNPTLKDIKLVDENVWRKDALITIFKVMANLWVKVWNCFGGKSLKTQANIERVIYHVSDKEEALEQIEEHWKTYKHLFLPRATFLINESQECEWEELF